MQNRILVVAGTIGSGKSAVCEILKKHIEVISLDYLGKQAHNDKDVINKVSQHFGSEIITNGIIDVVKLRQAAFNSKSNNDILNEITHPVIYKLLNQLLNNAKGDVVIEAPLYTNYLAELANIVWYVTCDKQLQYQRVKERGIDTQLIDKIFENQITTIKWSAVANEIITTNSDLSTLEITVDQLISKYNLHK